MRILRLQLHDVGRHKDLDVEFAPGLTIVRGPNESGKSTIQRAIELGLYRKPTATGAELESLRTWGASDEEHCWVRLEFTVEDEDPDTGETTSTPGALEKEYRGQRGRVSLTFDGQTFADPARADQIVAELTGIPNEAFFRSTASIRHEELDDLDRDEGALRDRLQASIGGGDKGSSRAKRRLEEAIRALKARGEKNPGRLKIAEETVAQAEASLRNGEAALARLERDRDALVQAREARSRGEAALAESRGMLDAARQADRLRSDLDVISERYERYRQAAGAQERLRALEAMPERSMPELRETLDRMRTMQSRVTILQEALREGKKEDVHADEPEPRYILQAIAMVAFLGVSAVVLALGLFGGMGAAFTVGGALIATPGLYCAGLFWERFSKARRIHRLNEARERERAIQRQTRVGNEEGLRVAQAAVQSILRELGVGDPGEAEELLSIEQNRRQDIATLRVQVAALLVGTSEEGLIAQRDQAALELEQKKAAMEALGPIATDARARERLEAEVRERQAALERLRDAEAASIARVDANPVDAEQVAGEAERLATWREQLAALKRRLRIYEMTLVEIQKAERQTMKKATRFLEQHMGKDVARLTGGRYRRVRVDDRSLDIEVWAPERGDWVSAGALSKGTVDQIFLAARLGLVRLVTEGRRPPLVLDDPFVTFDDARAARAALLLRELAVDFQVLYLACSNRYDGLADAVVELAGPTETEASALAAGLHHDSLADPAGPSDGETPAAAAEQPAP